MVAWTDFAIRNFERWELYDSRVTDVDYVRNLGEPQIDIQEARMKGIKVPLQFSGVEATNVYQELGQTTKALYGLRPHDAVTIERVQEMPSCTYNPLEVQVQINGQVEQTWYLKNPAPARILGKCFYNHLLPDKHIDFVFSPTGLAVAQVPGKLQSEYDPGERRHLTNNQAYLQNLVRMGVFAKTILLADMENPDNFTVDCNKEIHVLDFDQAFSYGEYSFLRMYGNSGENRVSEKEVASLQAKMITRAARVNAHQVNKLLRILEEVDINERLAWEMGADNIAEIVKRNLEHLATL